MSQKLCSLASSGDAGKIFVIKKMNEPRGLSPRGIDSLEQEFVISWVSAVICYSALIISRRHTLVFPACQFRKNLDARAGTDS